MNIPEDLGHMEDSLFDLLDDDPESLRCALEFIDKLNEEQEIVEDGVVGDTEVAGETEFESTSSTGDSDEVHDIHSVDESSTPKQQTQRTVNKSRNRRKAEFEYLRLKVQ